MLYCDVLSAISVIISFLSLESFLTYIHLHYFCLFITRKMTKKQQGKKETRGRGVCPRSRSGSTARDKHAGVGKGIGASDVVGCCVVGEGFAPCTGEEAFTSGEHISFVHHVTFRIIDTSLVSWKIFVVVGSTVSLLSS